MAGLAAWTVLSSAQYTDEDDGSFQLNSTADMIGGSDASFKSNFSTLSCVSPDAFKTCTANATTTHDTCTSACPTDQDDDGYESCHSDCDCQMTSSQMNCFLESCWNLSLIHI